MDFFDLNIAFELNDAFGEKAICEKSMEEIAALAYRMGWAGICLCIKPATSGSDNFFSVVSEIKSKFEKDDFKIFLACCISDSKSQKKSGFDAVKTGAKRAIDSDEVDFIYASGGDEVVNRSFSELWEIDMLCHPETPEGDDIKFKIDFMRQRNSGIDRVIGDFMAERNIAAEFNINNLLHTNGALRSQILGRMRQNVKIARKSGVNIILTSGAKSLWDMRAPRQVIALGRTMGMTEKEAKDAVVKNPALLMKKSQDRKNDDIITEGVQVIRWGGHKKKKMRYGFL